MNLFGSATFNINKLVSFTNVKVQQNTKTLQKFAIINQKSLFAERCNR